MGHIRRGCKAVAKSKIIKDLAKGSIGVETALKELKLLLLSFPNEKLTNWVNKELQGYGPDDDLPSYRTKAASLKGSFVFYNTSITNAGIPIKKDAPEIVKNSLNSVDIRDSIRSLSRLENKDISFPIPPDLYPHIMKYSMVEMTGVLNAKLDVSATTVSEILSAVENRVLDAMLVLEEEFGCLDDLDIDLSNSTQDAIDDTEKRLLVIIYNDNSITIGDKNRISDTTIF